MRHARTLLLAAATAITATAFLATSAFAQSVEVINEDTEFHCPDTVIEEGHNVSGGCEIHASTEAPASTFAHITGAGEIQTSSCENNLELNINEDGVGYIDVDQDTLHENEATGCPLEACDEPAIGDTPHADLEWPITGMSETGASTEEITITFCIRNHANSEGTGNTPCTVALHITQTDHMQELQALEKPCEENPIIELTGHWLTNIERGQVRIEHIHYPGDNP